MLPRRSWHTALIPIYRKVRQLLIDSGLRRIYPGRLLPQVLVTALLSRPIEIHGHQIMVDAQDSLELLREGTYEPNVTALVERIIKPDDVVIDIGANIGYFTLLFAEHVGPGGRVYAFEPDPSNFSLLVHNIAVNGYKNVTAIRKAVSDADDRTRLYIGRVAKDHSLASISQRWIEVETVRLDDYLPPATHVDFVKMDIEGAEGLALRGMSSVLQANSHVKLLTEFNPFRLQQCGTDPASYLRALRDLGFSLYYVGTAGESFSIDLGDFLLSAKAEDLLNLLCLRH